MYAGDYLGLYVGHYLGALEAEAEATDAGGQVVLVRRRPRRLPDLEDDETAILTALLLSDDAPTHAA